MTGEQRVLNLVHFQAKPVNALATPCGCYIGQCGQYSIPPREAILGAPLPAGVGSVCPRMPPCRELCSSQDTHGTGQGRLESTSCYTLEPTNNTLHTFFLHSTCYTLHTSNYIPHNIHYTLSAIHYTLHTTLHTTHFILHNTH